MTLVALLAFAGNAMADTTKLLAADGWTKITTLPSSSVIGSNYYVFVDTNNDLMLGTGKGVNQNTKWYSLGVYYYTSVEPTTAAMNNMTWTLESYDGGYAMRNLEYSALVFQTEWNAAYKWDTNDVPTPNGWAKINLAYSDGAWTIENGHDVGNYIGPWVGGNFTNGAECAGNKTASGEIGKFQIYTISRAQFKQNLLDNASSSNPVDLTPWYVTNATFDLGNRDGWTQEGSGGNNNTSYGGGCEIWHRSGFNIYQELTVPNGKYKVSLQMAGTTGAGVVYGSSGGTEKTAASSAAAGSNFQNTILSMIQDRTFGQTITDEITVSNGSLTIGMRCGTTDQWINFDNFKLYCTGVDLSSYQSQLDALVAECNTFISSNVVPDACETIVSNAVSTYNQIYSTAAEYSAAIVALTNVLDTYRNDTDLQTAYANFYSYKTTIQALSDGQPSSTALTTFNNALSTATTNVEAATTEAAINTEIANLRTAGLTYISTADGQFDITFLATQNYWEWRKYNGTAAGENAGIVADQFLTNRPSSIPSFAESYETTCATTGNVLWQTIEDLPAGYYQVGMYAAAMYTSGRGFDTEATEGDADRTYAFAGDLNDASSILRTGTPISFAGVRDFNDLTTLDVNVHLTGSGNTNDLTFGLQKDSNGSNWHFAQIISIIYSNSPDLTQLEATRDQLVAEAEGLLASSGQYLTSAQQTALQNAIDAGEAADDFDSLNTVTLTTLPDAINAAKQQIAQAKAAIPELHAALERFEQYYNLVDGTDYRRVTMSAKAWTDLLAAVDVVTQDLDDISRASSYVTDAAALNAQMDATDVSIRLFKSYKAMVEGCQSLGIAEGTTYAADSYMDTDATEQTAITALNTAFITYRESQTNDVDMAGFLGANLDFSETQGSLLVTGTLVYDLVGWEETYSNVQANERIQTEADGHNGELYLRSNWTDKNPVLEVAKLKMLPEGDYQLTLSWNSPMTNMTNHSAYVLGNTSTAIGEATSAVTTLTYDFTVSGEATDFDLILGFQKQNSGNTGAEIVADNIQLICIAGTPFQRAYDAAEAADLDTDATAAAKAATTEYAQYDGNESGLLTEGVRGDTYWEAVYVLRNAKTIADNNGDATSLVANADLTNTTKDGNFPTGWTGTYEGNDPGGNAWIAEQEGYQVFNIWANSITLIDMMQTINNLPKGIYRLSLDMGTNAFREDGSARLFNFINPANMSIGASELVTTENTGTGNRNFDTYTSAAEVGDAHSATIGVRSDGYYFQMKDIKFEYIGNAATAAREASDSYVRQDFYWNDMAVSNGELDQLFYDGAKYSAAQDVMIYPQYQADYPNVIIHGLEGMFDESVASKVNVDEGGTCASLTVTDGYKFVNTKEFSATAATYTRNINSAYEWGTVIMPYPLASNDNVQYYEIYGIKEVSGSNCICLDKLDEVATNTPVVFRKKVSDAESVTMTGSGTVPVLAASTTEEYQYDGDFTQLSVTGLYDRQVIAKAEIDENIYYIAQDKFWKAKNSSTDNITIPAFRAYITWNGDSETKYLNLYIVDEDATKIVDLSTGTELQLGDIYSVGGQLVRKNPTTLEGLPAGIYVVGGKKVVIR